jgi:recombinational DNA repair protein (RecF pathway)
MTIPYNTNTTTFIVPTKVGDNCSYSASLMKQITGEDKPEKDAFQFYSSDLQRLKTLILGSDEDDDELNALAAVNDVLRRNGLSGLTASHASEDEDASKRRRGNNSQAIKQQQNESGAPPRKSRLSWEVHPSLLLHDLYDEDIHSVSDDDEAKSTETAPELK